MYAIIRDRGQQYRVSQGDTILMARHDQDDSSEVVFDQVLMVGLDGDGNATVGTPTIDGAQVRATVLGNIKAKKIKVGTYKPRKKTSRTRMGHRQTYTRLRIEAIEPGSAGGA